MCGAAHRQAVRLGKRLAAYGRYKKRMAMQESINETHVFKVGPWDFSPKLKELKGEGRTSIKLEDKISHVLETLCIHDGAPVSKEELITAVWDGREVSEQTVPVAISKLRKLLGDDTNAPSMLETVPRKGYRLMVPPTEAVMAEVLGKGGMSSGLTRFALALSLLAIIFVSWSMYQTDDSLITSPAAAGKPGIILTINDVRTGGDKSKTQRAIALSELASFYLSQVPDVLVIRHWWNLDAPDPTGGIYTRYGAETPVYSVTAIIIDTEGTETVAIMLSDPKTKEVIWSGMHLVADGTSGYFGVLGEMLGKVGISGSQKAGAAFATYNVLEDDRYWVGRYFSHLSNESAAKTAEKAWQAISIDQPDNPVINSAHRALSARWKGSVSKAQPWKPAEAETGNIGLVDRGAIALFRDENAVRAITLLEAALEVAPGDHYALSVLGEAKLLAGDRSGGIEAYKKAIRLAPFARSYAARLTVLQASAAPGTGE